jgi:hypothetical protein
VRVQTVISWRPRGGHPLLSFIFLAWSHLKRHILFLLLPGAQVTVQRLGEH